jgi:hypothetical protein
MYCFCYLCTACVFPAGRVLPRRLPAGQGGRHYPELWGSSLERELCEA